MRRKSNREIYGTVICAVLVFVLLIPAARARTTLGAIVATITDSTGAVVPGVQVTVTNQVYRIVEAVCRA